MTRSFFSIDFRQETPGETTRFTGGISVPPSPFHSAVNIFPFLSILHKTNHAIAENKSNRFSTFSNLDTGTIATPSTHMPTNFRNDFNYGEKRRATGKSDELWKIPRRKSENNCRWKIESFFHLATTKNCLLNFHCDF
jgi:hypothetical protein